MTLGCKHEHVAWPQGKSRDDTWQRCLDCGARRRYEDIGSEPGPWEAPEPVEQQQGVKQ